VVGARKKIHAKMAMIAPTADFRHAYLSRQVLLPEDGDTVSLGLTATLDALRQGDHAGGAACRCSGAVQRRRQAHPDMREDACEKITLKPVTVKAYESNWTSSSAAAWRRARKWFSRSACRSSTRARRFAWFVAVVLITVNTKSRHCEERSDEAIQDGAEQNYGASLRSH